MPLNLGNNSRRDARQQIVWQSCPVGSHPINARHRPDCDNLFIGAFIAHHANLETGNNTGNACHTEG